VTEIVLIFHASLLGIALGILTFSEDGPPKHNISSFGKLGHLSYPKLYSKKWRLLRYQFFLKLLATA